VELQLCELHGSLALVESAGALSRFILSFRAERGISSVLGDFNFRDDLLAAGQRMRATSTLSKSDDGRDHGGWTLADILE
jgi:hypothetical protein